MATHLPNGSTTTSQPQTFVRDGQEYTQVREGLASILVPFSKAENQEKTAKSIEEQQQVFYNPIQQFNRDLTILAIKAYGEELMSKPRSGNAKQIAKRKRDRSDIDNRSPKKQEQSSNATEAGTTLTTNCAQTNDAEPEERDTPMADAHEGKQEADEDTEKSTAGIKAKGGDATRNDAPHGPRFTILDALSATGLRALRYAQELPFVTSVTANDLSSSAVEAIRRNAEHNGVESKINANLGDARAHMYSMIAEEVTRDHDREKHAKRNRSKGKRYNVIDLDPYGTAAPFLDAAVNAVRDDGGLLCVTCTDSGVWASNGYPEKAYSLYGGVPIKGFYSHEVGLRLILHTIATSAARYGLAIEPLISLSIDYYVRIFVKITKSPAQVKFLAGKTMVVYNCDQGCGAWETQLLARNKKATNKSGKGSYYKHGFALAPTVDSNCKHCNSKMHLAGPMYAGSLHSPDFIKRILDELPNASDDIYGTKPRIEGVLHTALEESLPRPEDSQPKIKEDEYAALEPYPFFFHPTNLAGAIHCVCPDEDSFRGALRHLGYEVTRSHCKPGSMRTNASWSIVWHIMREWVRQRHPVKTEKIAENSPAYKLLRLGGNNNKRDDEVDKLEVVFDQKLGRDKSRQGLSLSTDSAGESVYEVFWLREEEQDGKPSSFTLCRFSSRAVGNGDDDGDEEEEKVPQALLDAFLIDSPPSYLQPGPSRRVHVLVSTLAGTGLGMQFYGDVLAPLLEALGLTAAAAAETGAPGRSDAYHLVVTQDAQSVKDFARELGGRGGRGDGGSVSTVAAAAAGKMEEDVEHTVVLLSGDGGVVDMLNGRASTAGDGDDDDNSSNAAGRDVELRDLPLIAMLPLGTGNALFNSLHKTASPPAASVLVQGLRTLLRGKAAPLPSFQAVFPEGSRMITYSKAASSDSSPSTNTGGSSNSTTNNSISPPALAPSSLQEQTEYVSRLYGVVVASYGFHSQLVWESDTPAYRRHGAKRFGMVAAELLKESHAYRATVEVVPSSSPLDSASASTTTITTTTTTALAPGSTEEERGGAKEKSVRTLDLGDRHAYVLATLVSNLEKTFCISPASRPLDGRLRLVHFGPVDGAKTMEIMMAAYDGGKHVDMRWKGTTTPQSQEQQREGGGEERVGYEEISEVRITTHEEDARWRKVCIDGTIVEIPVGGCVIVRKETRPHLRVLVDDSVVS
ncbi:TRM-domain-containing protein [Xylariaceae sp. FL1651]|nr:TRM-domain-containing protein [Xylariaceae sp. FL1651]